MDAPSELLASARVSPGGARLPSRCRPKNPLLVRDDVGKAKATCYDLPPSNVAYGQKGLGDCEGAREVTMQWMSHTPRPQYVEQCPDFKKFNKTAISNRVTTARDRSRLIREVGNLPVCSPRSQVRVPAKALPSDTTPGWTYGRKIRPSTPIQDVMAYKYAAQGEADLQEFYSQLLESQVDQRHVRKIPLTKASRAHGSAAKQAMMPEESKELFKLSKFKSVGPKVQVGRARDNMPGMPPRGVPGFDTPAGLESPMELDPDDLLHEEVA